MRKVLLFLAGVQTFQNSSPFITKVKLIKFFLMKGLILKVIAEKVFLNVASWITSGAVTLSLKSVKKYSVAIKFE